MLTVTSFFNLQIEKKKNETNPSGNRNPGKLKKSRNMSTYYKRRKCYLVTLH